MGTKARLDCNFCTIQPRFRSQSWPAVTRLIRRNDPLSVQCPCSLCARLAWWHLWEIFLRTVHDWPLRPQLGPFKFGIWGAFRLYERQCVYVWRGREGGGLGGGVGAGGRGRGKVGGGGVQKTTVTCLLRCANRPRPRPHPYTNTRRCLAGLWGRAWPMSAATVMDTDTAAR